MPQAFIIYNLNTVAVFVVVVAWLLNECKLVSFVYLYLYV